MRRETWGFWGVAAVVVGLDQWTKLAVWGWSAASRPFNWSPIPGFLRLHNAATLNTGVAFGTGSGYNTWWTVAGLLIGFFVWYLYRSAAQAHAAEAALSEAALPVSVRLVDPAASTIAVPAGAAFREGLWGTALALGLVLGGALGNFVDRLAFAGVRDFVEFVPVLPVVHWRWAAFNLADAAITVGVILYFLLAARAWLRERRRAAASHAEPAFDTQAQTKAVLPELLGTDPAATPLAPALPATPEAPEADLEPPPGERT